MAHVIIPYPLRKHTFGQRNIQVSGETMAAVLNNLLQTYPGLQVINEQPGLLSLFVNGKAVETSAGNLQDTSLIDADEISLIIPIAGG